MPNPKDNLKDRLASYRQIKISVIGRKSGKTISIPVWFVVEGEKLFLLAVQVDRTPPVVQERAQRAEDSN